MRKVNSMLSMLSKYKMKQVITLQIKTLQLCFVHTIWCKHCIHLYRSLPFQINLWKWSRAKVGEISSQRIHSTIPRGCSETKHKIPLLPWVQICQCHPSQTECIPGSFTVHFRQNFTCMGLVNAIIHSVGNLQYCKAITSSNPVHAMIS